MADTPELDRVNEPIRVGGVTVPPGRKIKTELLVARLPTGSQMSIPVVVVNGRTSGPNVWISGGIHGDEVNGVEVVRRILRTVDAKSLRGALIGVPIANPLGFLMRTRYLPDRRDLNRAFPGSRRGSTASRIANMLMSEIVSKCSVGIDCHTASNHRINIPQIRADIDDPQTVRLITAFGAPFAIKSKLRDGSLRQAADELGIKVLVFEAGQANRLDEEFIELGVSGVLRTLRSMGMIDMRLPRATTTRFTRRSRWVRARRGGLVEGLPELGSQVSEGQVVASISDAFGGRPTSVKAPMTGWVIARTLNPLVNPGDALVHIATE